MASSNIASTIDPYHKITNLQEYLFLKSVRANTSLVNGKIIYEGKEYSERDYNDTFPKPVIRYDTQNADGNVIEK